MGGCEVREFLWQFGFFLPLRTAWPGYCSHVSNNQGKGQGQKREGEEDDPSLAGVLSACCGQLVSGQLLQGSPYMCSLT